MGISLGGLEVVTDFLFTNPEFYESDIADVKSTMYGQPVAKQHYEKPVRPKKTKEAIMNKFSIIQRKPVIQSDEIFESPIIASEDTSFDDSFDDMEITSNNKNNNDNNNDNDTEILEANALLQKLSNIQNSGDMSAISSALDIDYEDDDDLNIVDEDSDEDIDNIDDDDINIVDDDDDFNIIDDDSDEDIDDDDDFNIVDEDNEDDDLNIVDDDDDLNIVDEDDDLNIVDEDSEDDDFNIVDDDIDDEETYGLNDDDDLNIVDDDDDINIVDDDDEEYDTDDDEETFDLDDLDIEEPSKPSNSKKDTNAVSTEKLNEKEEAVLSDYENNFNLNTKQETSDSKKDSENDELKLMKKRFAELEKQLHELQNEKASNNTSNLVENNNKDLKTDSIDSIIEKAKHRKAESDTKNDASEDIHLKYTCMSVESLYKEVKDYMNELGVRQKVIDVSTLNDKFGEKNIRKLIQKSYLIKIGSKGVTTGR